MKKNILIFILIILGLACLWFYYFQNVGEVQNSSEQINEFNQNSNENVNAEQNNFNQGTQNTIPAEQIESELRDLSVQTNDVIASPVVVEGKAKKEWFEEGKFSVYVLDEQKNTLGSGTAIMKEQLFDEEFVSFIATVDFSATASTGLLVLRKGISPVFSQSAMQHIISVQIKQNNFEHQANGCKPSGCSGQVCSDQDVITDCAYKEQYVCYEKAKCERQENGQCGWTQTKELVACLGQFE